MKKIMLVLCIATLGMYACGGGSSSSSDTDTPAAVSKQGRFIDSAVEGLTYKTITHTGTTDVNGTFNYEEGETISFSVGSTMLGSVTASPLITPIDLVQGAINETHPQVSNIIIFLQTIDTDQNPQNGITIPTTTIQFLEGRAIDFATDSTAFLQQTALTAFLDTINSTATDVNDKLMVTEDRALTHMRQTMAELWQSNPDLTMEQDIRAGLGILLSIAAEGAGESDTTQFMEMLSQNIDTVLLQGSLAGCPEIKVTPFPIFPLASQNEITISLDFKDGCTAQNGATMKGTTIIKITNIDADDLSDISADYVCQFENITQNGMPLLHGTVSGILSAVMNATGEITDFSTGISFDDLTAGQQKVTGGVSFAKDSQNPNGDITISFNEFGNENHKISSGTIKISSQDGETTQITISNLETQRGTLNTELAITKSSETGIVVNSMTQARLGPYTLEIKSLTLDHTICPAYPIAGQLIFTRDGISATINFSDKCDGLYNYTENS